MAELGTVAVSAPFCELLELETWGTAVEAEVQLLEGPESGGERESERWWWRVPLGMLQHFALTAGRGSSVGHGPNFLKILVEVGWFGLCRLSFLLHV